MIQGGAGTSSNMNANEVMANRALEILGKERGQYDIVHPNNHVNLSQSTNDVYPISVKLALHTSIGDLQLAMIALAAAFLHKYGRRGGAAPAQRVRADHRVQAAQRNERSRLRARPDDARPARPIAQP